MGKAMDSQPPTLSANAPMPSLSMDNNKKYDMMPSNKGTPLMSGSNSRKPDNDMSMEHSHNNEHNSGHGSHVTPKAVVKPNVLTHVIDGHIIQESSQPFPLDNSDSKGRQRILSKSFFHREQ
jgi:hypothetical protein